MRVEVERRERERMQREKVELEVRERNACNLLLAILFLGCFVVGSPASAAMVYWLLFQML